MSTIGFIGLGHMGHPMAANQVKAGHTVKGFDLDAAAMSRAAADGVTTVGSIAEAVDGVDLVVTMLPKGEHALSAYAEIFANAPTSALLVDSSTIDIESCTTLHEEAGAKGFRFVDAPVSGGISGAQAGTLAFMLGGSDENVAEARPHIEPMAGNIIHAGGPTAGQAAKICNNLILFINLASTCEGAVLASRLGLDPQVFWDIASVSSANSWALQTWYPIPGVVETAASNNDFEPTFTVDLANKDIQLALAAAEGTQTPLNLGARVQSQLQEMADAGFGGLDCSSIVKLVDGSQGASK